MPAHLDLIQRAAALKAAGTQFVWATVVRAQRPTSAKPGDSALVLSDGEIDGFVGGDCAEATVRVQALEVLASGTTRLLRITPTDEAAVPAEDGTVTVHNPCLSGGTLEIFLEPSLPLPVVAVFGHAPIATALLRADRLFGMQVKALAKPDEPLPPGTVAVVVASHGNDEHAALTAALTAGVPYIGLVASRTRGPAVVEELAVDEKARRTVHTPAGLDIGARSAPAVALSILAEIVAESATHTVAESAAPTVAEAVAGEEAASADRLREAEAGRGAGTAVDPVCGMRVAAVDASPHAETPSGTIYFCGTGCLTAYLDNPAVYQT